MPRGLAATEFSLRTARVPNCWPQLDLREVLMEMRSRRPRKSAAIIRTRDALLRAVRAGFGGGNVDAGGESGPPSTAAPHAPGVSGRTTECPRHARRAQAG